MHSSDQNSRDLVSTIPGGGWDFGISRHPYFEYERPLGPHYTVYNRRLMACCFDTQSTDDGYWLLRQKAAVLHTGELPLQFTGPDAETLLNRLFTKDITRLKPGRCGYGLACYEDGGLITDGILLRLQDDRFWYAQADGDFYSWARAQATGLDVSISDPKVFVSQVQGPEALNVLAAATDNGMPSNFSYFGIATVSLGGQEVIITRTGYTNELGFEFYTEPHHDADALWQHLTKAGEPFGLAMHGLDAMNIRRIEAGILNAGADFNEHTTPYDVNLGRFVDTDKQDFIGRDALLKASQTSRLFGLRCEDATPLLHSPVVQHDQVIGTVTAAAWSPYLRQGVGIALMDEPAFKVDDQLEVIDTSGQVRIASVVDLPFYDKEAQIPRGKLIDVPERS